MTVPLEGRGPAADSTTNSPARRKYHKYRKVKIERSTQTPAYS